MHEANYRTATFWLHSRLALPMIPPMMRVLRGAWLWAALLTLAVVGRDAIDWWLSPTDDFYARSVVSTALAVAVFAGAGLWRASRSRSIRAGVLAGAAAGLLSAVAVDLVALAMLAARHDPHTMTMIRASGGFSEALVLPFVVVVPGTACAAAGAVAGKAIAWLCGYAPRSSSASAAS
jgi:hypothetical protein